MALVGGAALFSSSHNDRLNRFGVDHQAQLQHFCFPTTIQRSETAASVSHLFSTPVQASMLSLGVNQIAMESTNTLDRKDRADLVRRTRKLQDVLGVPLHVVGANALPSPTTPTNMEPQSQPRKRTKSIKRKKMGPEPEGSAMSTSTAVQVDAGSPTSSPFARSASLHPPSSSAPFTSHRASLRVARAVSNHAALSRQALQPKKSLIFNNKAKTTDIPVLQLAPAASQPSADGPSTTPRLTRSRSVSNASNGTLTTMDSSLSINDSTLSPGVDPKRRFSLPPSPSSSTFEFPKESISADALRQRHINMASKLQRHLGEPIPPELLTGSSRLVSPMATTIPVPPIEPALEPVKTHKHSRSLWAGLTKRTNSTKQDRVLESTVISATRTSAPPPRPPRSAARARGQEYAAYHRKVMSDSISVSERGSFKSSDDLLSRKQSLLSISKSVVDVEIGSSGPTTAENVADARMNLSAREKSLSVRRAAKMAQKFGEVPPQALLQITNLTSAPDHREVDDSCFSSSNPKSPLPSEVRRLSRTSTISFTSLQSDENEIPGLVRARSGSVGSVAAKSRASRTSLISLHDLHQGQASLRIPATESKVSLLEDGGVAKELKKSSKAKANVAPMRITLPNPSSPTSDTSSTPTPTKTIEHQLSLKSSKSPTSSSRAKSTASVKSASVRPGRSQSHSFSSRRRQANKLTQFFGVDYPDLYQAMVIGNPMAHLNNSTVSLRSATAPPAILLDEEQPPLPSASDTSRTTVEIDRKESTGISVNPASKPALGKMKRRISAAGLDDWPMLKGANTVITASPGTWDNQNPQEIKMVMDKLRKL